MSLELFLHLLQIISDDFFDLLREPFVKVSRCILFSFDCVEFVHNVVERILLLAKDLRYVMLS